MCTTTIFRPAPAAALDDSEPVSPTLLGLLRPVASPGHYALDVGCGEGHLTSRLAPRFAHVIGIDLDLDAVDAAQSKAFEKGIENATFFVADAEHADYCEFLTYEPYDLVCAHRCFSEAIAHRAFAALRPGGHLLAAAHHPDQWQETGCPSSFALSGGRVCEILQGAGFETESLCLEKDLLEYESPERLAADWLERPDRPAWLTPERARGIEAHAGRGGTTLTIRSQTIVRARKVRMG